MWHPVDIDGRRLAIGQAVLVENGCTEATVEALVLSSEEQRSCNVEEPGVMFTSPPFGRLFIPLSLLEQDKPVPRGST